MSFTSRFASSDFCRTVKATSLPSGEIWGSSRRRVASSSSGVKGRPANAAGERHNVTAIRKRMMPAPVAQRGEGAKAEGSAAPSALARTFAIGIDRRQVANAKRSERLFREMRNRRVFVVREVEQDVSSFPSIHHESD